MRKWSSVKVGLSVFLLLSLFLPPAWSEEAIKPVKLTLQDCYQLALKRSETIAIRKEEIERTEAQFLQAAGEVVGDMDFVISNTRQDAQKGTSTSSSTLTAPSRRERKFALTQPLFQGFKSFAAISGAGSLKKQRKAEEARARQLLFLDVTNAFYEVLRSQRDIEITEKIRRLLEERVGDLKEREKIGRSRPSEVVTASAKEKSTDAELARLARTLANQLHILEFLIGTSAKPEQLQDEIEAPGVKPELAEYLLKVHFRLDVEASRQAAKTALQNIVVAQSGLWPQLDLELNKYEKREGPQSGIDWDMLLTFTIPIFKGGETAGKIKDAVSLWKQSKLSSQLTEREAALEVKQAFEDVVASQNELRALEEFVKASEENFRLQREEYAKNLVNNLEVLAALESLSEAQVETNRAHYQWKENFWKLQVASGVCCESV